MAETTLQLQDGDDLIYQDNDQVLLEEVSDDEEEQSFTMKTTNCGDLIPEDSRFVSRYERRI